MGGEPVEGQQERAIVRLTAFDKRHGVIEGQDVGADILPFCFEAVILSRIRSAVTSRSN